MGEERLFAESGALLKGSGVKLALESRSVTLNGIGVAAEVRDGDSQAEAAVRLPKFPPRVKESRGSGRALVGMNPINGGPQLRRQD